MDAELSCLEFKCNQIFLLFLRICNVELPAELETRAQNVSVAVFDCMSTAEYHRIGVYKNTYIKTG